MKTERHFCEYCR